MESVSTAAFSSQKPKKFSYASNVGAAKKFYRSVEEAERDEHSKRNSADDAVVVLLSDVVSRESVLDDDERSEEALDSSKELVALA